MTTSVKELAAVVKSVADQIRQIKIEYYKIQQLESIHLFRFCDPIVKLLPQVIDRFALKLFNGATVIDHNGLAISLLRETIYNENFELETFLDGLSKQRDGDMTFRCVLNVLTDSELKLSECLSVRPYDQLVSSGIIDNYRDGYFFDHLRGPVLQDRGKLSVLEFTSTVENIIAPSIEDMETPDGQEHKKYLVSVFGDELKSLRDFLSLVCDHAVIQLAGWMTYSEERLNVLLKHNWNLDPKIVSSSIDPFTIPKRPNWNLFGKLYERKEEINQVNKLSLAIERIQLAKSNDRLESRWIDLSIAIEIMCVSGSGDNTYKVSNHMAWALGSTPEEKKDIRSKVKAFYSIRSAIVHNGKMSTKKTKKYEPFKALYDDILGLTQKAIIKFAEFGEIPDWNRVSDFNCNFDQYKDSRTY